MSIPLAIVWHQHQPFYQDLRTGDLTMPWVRLHGIKDYYGMAKLVEEFPGVHCTVNLVPSMIVQLQEYVEKDAKDALLRHTEIPAEELTEKQACYVLDNFFQAQYDNMIRIHPRYHELAHLRRLGRRSARSALADFDPAALRDLQVWFNLAWFHPLCFEEFEALRVLREKGKEFTESDKAQMLSIQNEIMARVIPLHKKLALQGQLELTTTPFYHPILPLLCDMQSAREAMPDVPMPDGYFSMAEDAEAHVEMAVSFHRKIFDEAPRGMWPSEGSVSPPILPILARHGIQWLATDEGILSASLATSLRGAFGKIERPDLLYRPWKVSWQGAHLNAVFRDHELSDRVGFKYQNWEGGAAADDFLHRIRDSAKGRPAGEDTLVSVILDGENCWEHYPGQGVGFLRSLYAKLQDESAGVSPVRVCDFLDKHPPTNHHIEKLFSGSWINHDFHIWVGHEEDRKAWEYVFRVREDLVEETNRRGGRLNGDKDLAKAWEELYIAEGSDWYWWYGDDHSSGNDEGFDELFRTHLKNVYRFTGLEIPYFLDNPVITRGAAGAFTKPTGVLQPVLDGRVTSFFEWMGAGRYRSEKDGGTMAASERPLIQQIFFGYDRDHLCLRVDLNAAVFHASSGENGDAPSKHAELLFVDPKGLTLEVKAGESISVSQTGPWVDTLTPSIAAWDQILELRIPFKAFGVAREQEMAFYIDIKRPDGTADRYPRSYALSVHIPPDDVEERDWFI